MIFDEYQGTIQVWRQIKPDDWSDPVWTRQSDIKGRIEPVAGDETYLNNQAFNNVVEIGFHPIDYANSIMAMDVLVDQWGIQREIVGIPEIYRYQLPYVQTKLKRAQWKLA